MKSADANLIKYLAQTTDFRMCDLYEITLFDGAVFRYADYDRDIKLADGRLFSCSAPGFERDKISLTADEVIDSLNIELNIDETDKMNGVGIVQLARNGGFDDARLSLYRCFLDEKGNALYLLKLFTGEIETPEGGGLSLELDVNSLANKLNNNFPTRCYYPTCPFSLYDSMCGVNLADYKKTGTVISATKKIITSNLSFTNGYYEQGGLEFLTGVLAGTAHAVRYSNNNTFELLIEAETAPSAGDTFIVYPGCDKTPDTCKNKFNNFARNRATPFIPIKETSVL